MSSPSKEDFSQTITEIISNFKFEGSYMEANPYGCGHINDTFVVCFKQDNCCIRRYILQRINDSIFKNPDALMKNIELVTNHIRMKIKAAGGDSSRETLSIVHTLDGKNYYRLQEGQYWRVYDFIEGTRTYQVVENRQHLYNAGKTFGRFQNLLSDFEAETLYETIADFHNTKKRYNAFLEALKMDCCNRAKEVASEIDFIKQRAEEIGGIVDAIETGKIPVRVTHNDTKFNNIMIDEKTGEGICVVDLDTVMPGSALYDFGDAIRSGTNPAEEDERNLDKVCMDLDLFEAYTKGYLAETGSVLNLNEIELLPLGAKIMTLECGMRFLTDYLNGDVYFKINRENHNLDRCRTQLKMVSDMETKWHEMTGIVNKYK